MVLGRVEWVFLIGCIGDERLAGTPHPSAPPTLVELYLSESLLKG